MKIRIRSVAVIFSIAVFNSAFGGIKANSAYRFDVFTDNTTLDVSYEETLDPATLEAPAFWFDASDTTGWTIADGKVTEIPSKSSERSLVYAWPENWNGWTDVETSAPAYSACDEESGLPCVDFGDAGSGRILMFDGGVITNIGTVVAVFNARNWGGWIFGGPNTSEGIWSWHRGRMAADNYFNGIIDYRNPIARAQVSSTTLTGSLFRQNGLPYVGSTVGWGGGWEVFSLNPTNATLLSATGLGFNDLSAGNGGISGGMKYSELLIYDRILDNATVAKIERFLARKWGLGARMFGSSSRVQVNVLYATTQPNTGMQVGFDVDEGTELVVKTVRGGYNAKCENEPKLVKTGAGTLKIGDFSRYDGTVELQEGNITLETPVATDDDDGFVLPDGVVCRFDVSDRDTMTLSEEDGIEYLTRIDDADGRTYAGSNGGIINLRSRGVLEKGGDQRPWLSDEYVTPAGLKMLDFGPWVSHVAQYSRGLAFYTGQTAKNPFVFTTVIAAVGAHRGGGWLCNGGFQRAAQSGSLGAGLLAPLVDSGASRNPISTVPYLTPTNGVVYIDGYKVESPHNTGYPSADYHVIAMQIPGSSPGVIGEMWQRVGGALILGEFIAWNRPLTEEEILRVQKRLSAKWFGKKTGRSDDVPMLAKLAVAAEGSVTVESGSAKVREIALNAKLVKKGPGTLFVNKVTAGAGGSLAVEEGAVKGGLEPALTVEGIAAAPSLRIDMADTNGWTMVEENGTNFVKSIPTEGEAGITAYNSNSAYYPFIRDEEDFIAKSGVPVLDFKAHTHPVTSASGYLGFDKSLESVRSVYVVWRLRPSSEAIVGAGQPQYNRAFMLGSMTLTVDDYYHVNAKNQQVHIALYRNDFHRGDNGAMWHNKNTSKAVRDGESYTNGVKIAADNMMNGFKPVEDSWQLVETHTIAGAYASAIGIDHGEKSGGFALAEMIVYERELSEREKTATRNYLMKKWLGKSDEELAPLPAAGNDPVDISELQVDGDAEIGSVGVKRLTGAGTVVKEGAGESVVFDAGAFTGSVAVAEGTLNFTGVCRAEPKMATDGLRMRLAADEGIALVDNADGTRGALEWANTVGDGWKAVAPTGYVISSGAKLSSYAPVYLDSGLNGLPVVDMPQGRCFRFVDTEGNHASVTGICNVFWVVGSARGGGFLLGGGNLVDAVDGRECYYTWHRGSATTESAGRSKNDSIIFGSGYGSTWDVAYAAWRKNDAAVADPQTEPLSGEWDQISYAAKTTSANAKYNLPSASGLAFDGRIFNGEDYRIRAGNQTLAEVLIYTNRLTEAEILETEAYLNCKWGLNAAVASADYAIDLTVAAGAVVNLASQVSFRSVDGAGTVNGNLSSSGLSADFSSDGFLSVNGVYTLLASPKIVLANVPENLPAEKKLLEADEFEGLENGRCAVATGDTDGGKLKVRLRVRDGALYAKVNTYNMVIICR